ncbi:MAG: serine hydrolase domain-containing protein [Gammaproteobacteria bacterium]
MLGRITGIAARPALAALLVALLPLSVHAARSAADAQAFAQALQLGDAAALRRVIIEMGTRDLVAGAKADGPIVGTAPIEDFLLQRPEVWLDPAYWSSYVNEVLLDFHFMLPMPLDPVKPEAFLPNVPVANGAYVSPLPQAVQDISQISYEWLGGTKTVQDFVHSTETDVVAIVHNGVLVGEIYANGYSPETRHQPWSVTKTFIAAVIGLAVEEGLIRSLQDPIDAYIADLEGTAWEGVSIENILQMESGVHWDEGTPVLVVNTQVEQWVDLALDLYTQGALGQTRNEFLASLPQVYAPGTEFRYNSGNTQVLAWLLETLYGQTFNDILAAKLWQPLGAAGDAVMISDRVGAVVASQGLYARPYDFARFGELLRNGGRTSDGRRVLPGHWITAMTRMTEVSGGAYGYQTWAAPTAGAGAFSASGFQGQKITVVPEACITGVRLSHDLGADLREGDDPTDPDAYGFVVEMGGEEFYTMLAAVAKELGGCKSGAAPTPGGAGNGGGGGGALMPWWLLPLAALRGWRRRRSA